MIYFLILSLPVRLFFTLFNLRFLFFILSLSSLSLFSFSVDFSPSLPLSLSINGYRVFCGLRQELRFYQIMVNRNFANGSGLKLCNTALSRALCSLSEKLRFSNRIHPYSLYKKLYSKSEKGDEQAWRIQDFNLEGQTYKTSKIFLPQDFIINTGKNIFSHLLHEEQVADPGF